MIAYTDYLFSELGDTPGKIGPMRKVVVVAYDGSKYATIHQRSDLT